MIRPDDPWPAFRAKAGEILTADGIAGAKAHKLAAMLAKAAASMPEPRTETIPAFPSTWNTTTTGAAGSPWYVQYTMPAPGEKADPADLTDEQRADLAARFAAGDHCPHCGGIHLRACPRVKRLAFHPDGTIIEAEFWPHGQWPVEDVIFPEDVAGDGESDGGRPGK